MIVYIENEPVPTTEIATLRKSVGWNGMEDAYNDSKMTSYFHIACYDAYRLIGYVDSVSNGVTDAYIQDLMVAPDYQGQGIGTELMNRLIKRLKENHIYMITVVFDEKLRSFYEKFGFYTMLSGQMQTYEMD